MKSFVQFILLALIASASAFAPFPQPQRTVAVSPLAATNNNNNIADLLSDKKAAIAAFATAVAPVAAANAVDESVVIGYGAGLVACVVSLAVGFAIGYGTLAKL
ncbi:hypothetical protein ACA910_004416 [Epithemia clementina (nom. ined.)]